MGESSEEPCATCGNHSQCVGIEVGPLSLTTEPHGTLEHFDGSSRRYAYCEYNQQDKDVEGATTEGVGHENSRKAAKHKGMCHLVGSFPQLHFIVGQRIGREGEPKEH